MNRILPVFLIILAFCFSLPVSAQQVSVKPAFKNGALPAAAAMIHRRLNHPLWKTAWYGKKYFLLVHFAQIPDAGQKQRLASRGLLLDQYVSGHNWLAQWKENGDLNSLKDNGITELYVIPPALKINRKLSGVAQENKTPDDLIAVSCFGDLDPAAVDEELQKAGAEIVPTKIKPAHIVFIRANPSILDKIAALPFVVSINPQRIKDVPLNDNTRAMEGVHGVAATSGRNLQGKGVTVGIGDDGEPSSHIDFAGRLIMRTDEPVTDEHGVHTSGTLAGAGIVNPIYKGMAPRARLITNDFSNILINAPVYVNDYGMVLTNNSYYNGLAGCPGNGDYDALSNYVDSQLSAHPKLLHVFAAGNDGATVCAPFPPDFATIKSGFQTAKNVLTVGGINSYTYTVYLGSSHGPVDDGRIKPEVVAAAVYVTSTFPGNAYGVLSGTSMSCPAATGILALVYERYRQLHGGADPDAALVKALVSNSADDFGNPGPDFAFGFGMINARTTVEALEQNHYFSGTAANGTSTSFTIPALPAGTHQVKIMLYWPDPAAQPYAASTLVNDLDLTVTDPSGTTHLPMILDPSTGGVNNNATEGADHINNIEQVVINNPPSGNFTISVKGSVPQGPQPFYIAYQIISPSVTVEYPFGTETLVPGESETIRWSAYGASSNTFSVEYSIDGGGNWILISNSISADARSYAWTVPAVVTKNALIRVTRNGAGYSDQSDFPFTIIGQPSMTLSKPCLGYAQLLWKTIPGADAYEIMKLSADTLQVIGNTTDTSFLVSALNKDSSYWFTVRAVTAGVPGRRALAGNIIPNGGSCTLTGLNNDLVMDALKVPVTGRQFTSSQLGVTRLAVTVRNSGTIATSAPVTFSYQVNGGAVVSEVYSGAVPGHIIGAYTFSIPNSFDFSAPGTYTIKTWIHYAPDPEHDNDTLTTVIKQLKNDPLVLTPSFSEGFEPADDQNWTLPKAGLDGLDRADFNPSNKDGRINTFFNTGFARTGNRSITLDVINSGAVAADSLITTFNLSGYSPTDQIWLDLYYKKQSALLGYPGNQIWIRGNDLAAWIPVKNLTDPADAVGIYNHVNLDVSGILSGASPAQSVSSSFQVRCGYEGNVPAASPIAGGLPGGGISFDDFTLSKSQDDAGVSTLLQPDIRNLCNLSDAEKVSLVVRNYAVDSLLNVPVSYAVNGDTVTETIPFIKPKDSVVFTFSKTADFSAFRLYNLKIWVSYPADNYRFNDSSRDYAIQTTPLVSQYPYLEGFESGGGGWYTNGQNDNWQWGTPQKTIIHKAANGSKAWVTNLTGNYNDNEYAYLYSPCFDLTSLVSPVLSFSHIFKMEDGCDCDFHWVEYSVDDSVWTVLGEVGTGVNGYDKAVPKAWQHSDPKWHVSSFDIPVKAPKLRFRIAMYSDGGTNDEGVGIDDVHVFDKAPVFTDSLHLRLSEPVNGNGWIDFDQNGKRILSLNPNGQNLGNVSLSLFIDSGATRDSAGQAYAGRNWVIRPEIQPADSVSVRYYFTDSEINKLIYDSLCPTCSTPEDAYSSGITQYSSLQVLEEDSSLRNNLRGSYLFHKPQQDVQIIPYDNGYYAETRIGRFSEFWINAGGRKQDHPLAAWLMDFTATAVNQTGLLEWTTWQEARASRFIIEKSGDSILFAPIGTVSGIPHTDATAAYTFTDPQLLGGHNYYRLKEVFVNGDSLYSPIRQILFDPNEVQIRVYPNPTSDQLSINSSAECRDIQIFDATGRLVYRKQTNGFQQTLSMATLSRGIYLMKLNTDKGGKVLKIEKR